MTALFTLRNTALLIALVALATIGGAWFIELVLGVKPCPLCLEQRIPYYAGIPVALAAAWTAPNHSRAARLLLALTALIFLIGAGMGAYHAGVEWSFWKGPADCTGPIAKPAAIGDFLKSLNTVTVIRCDEVAMRIFGLSLAAWNALIASAMAIYGAIVALKPQSS